MAAIGGRGGQRSKTMIVVYVHCLQVIEYVVAGFDRCAEKKKYERATKICSTRRWTCAVNVASRDKTKKETETASCRESSHRLRAVIPLPLRKGLCCHCVVMAQRPCAARCMTALSAPFVRGSTGVAYPVSTRRAISPTPENTTVARCIFFFLPFFLPPVFVAVFNNLSGDFFRIYRLLNVTSRTTQTSRRVKKKKKNFGLKYP